MIYFFQIVTYKCAKSGGIVEIMTETTTGGNGSSSGTTSIKNIIGNTVVKKTTAMTPVTATLLHNNTTLTAIPAKCAATAENKVPPRRRPMPRLIPIIDQKTRLPMMIRLQKPVPPPAARNAGRDDDNYYNVTAGQSTLTDFASIIDDLENNGVGVVLNSCFAGTGNPATGPTAAAADAQRSGNNTSPKSKSSSFFDKLKARVDETSDLTCLVCRYESKCLSEFMRHQRTHGNNRRDVHYESTVIKRQSIAPAAQTPTPPPPLLTAAALKSTRCQQCRKRCKTSAELVVHLATCRGTAAVSAAVDILPVSSNIDQETQQQQQQQHPMENRIFVWNTAAVVPAPRDEDAGTSAAADDDEEEDREEHSVTITPAKMSKPVVELTPITGQGLEEGQPEKSSHPSSVEIKRQLPPLSIRKEGKMYKTVSIHVSSGLNIFQPRSQRNRVANYHTRYYVRVLALYLLEKLVCLFQSEN